MTMMAERPTVPIPLEQALAELDSAESVSDRRQRAKEWAKKVEGDERDQLIRAAGQDALSRALAPRYRAGVFANPTASEKRGIERTVTASVDALVEKQAEESLRRSDEAALYRDPVRLRHQRVWNLYTTLVSQMAWRQGNKSDEWVRRWRDLIAQRAAAEEYGDPTGAIDARLRQHVGVEYPLFPEAAWAAVETIPGAAERQAEIEALEEAYPGTNPHAPATTEPLKPRRGRK